MKFDDALLNWLQIKIVAEARPDDHAAQETLDFFALVLREDHHLTAFDIDRTDGRVIYVIYETEEGERIEKKFDRVRVEYLLAEIASNPKYNEQ